MPRRADLCDECNGRGYFEKVDRQRCKNCDGEGSTTAGRGGLATCGSCQGQGEHVKRSREDCSDCGGTGRTGGSVREQEAEAAPEVVGKGQVAPPAGGSQQVDAETGESGPRPKAKAKSKAKSKAKAKGTGMQFGSSGSVNWDEEAGLAIDLTLSPFCFCSSVGGVCLAIGIVFMSRQAILWYLLGGVLACGGAGCLFKGNMAACMSASQKLTGQSG